MSSEPRCGHEEMDPSFWKCSSKPAAGYYPPTPPGPTWTRLVDDLQKLSKREVQVYQLGSTPLRSSPEFSSQIDLIGCRSRSGRCCCSWVRQPTLLSHATRQVLHSLLQPCFWARTGSYSNASLETAELSNSSSRSHRADPAMKYQPAILNFSKLAQHMVFIWQ